MPEPCCNLGNFSGALEVAFGLSAVLYYLELKNILEERIYKKFEELKRVINELPEARRIIASRSGLGHYKDEKQLSELVSIFTLHQKQLKFAVTIITIFSSFISLGALIYSGFYPDTILQPIYVILILIGSFSSIIYTLLVIVFIMNRIPKEDIFKHWQSILEERK